MAVAAGHAGGTALLTGLMLIAAGIFSIAGAAYDWDWFINHYKARLFLKIFGRTGTRTFYGVLGTAVLLGGVLTAVGVVKVDTRRRRFAMTQPAHPQAAPAREAGDASTDRRRLTGRVGPIETISPAPFNAPEPSAASSPAVALPSANKDGADAVSSGDDTQIFGGSFDPAFRDQAPDGGVLVGLDVGTAPGFGSEIVRTVRPIFHTSNGEEVLGQEHGSDAMKVTSVKAKEGYAIGGIIVKAGLCVDGFSIVFMRLKGDMLDPGDSYESEWFGGMGGNDKTKLACEGQPVIALIGKSNGRQCTGIGLSMKH